MSIYNKTEKLLSNLYPSQHEFTQAVLEVICDVQELIQDNPVYQDMAIIERMIEPDRLIHFRVCWEDDKGKIHVNRAWRVQFNNAIGAYKGGLRFHPSVNESILKFLGFEQCFKNALTGLPMGGGKGGSDFDPKGKSSAEIRRFCQSFMEALYPYIGEHTDVPAGDIGVGGREIGYMFGHYLKLTNRFTGVLTGKNPIFGGSFAREEATGFGAVYFLVEMLKAHDDTLAGKNVLISGAGNVALHAAEKCLEEKANVLSLSDSGGSLHFSKGMTPAELADIKIHKIEQYGRLAEWAEGKDTVTFRHRRHPWDIKADIAIPCATQNEVDGDEAKHMIAQGIKAVVEGANMPLTREAHAMIEKANIIFGPGKAANAGGVAVSGLERTQNALMRSWTHKEVDTELRKIMRDIHARCIQHVEKEKGVYPYKKGANIVSFKRLADTLVAYGTK